MRKGDFVRIEYTGRMDSGEVFDLTDAEMARREKIFNPKARYGVVPVIVGAGFVIRGLDKELEKMEVGEDRKVVIKPEEGFGERNAELVKTVPRSAFREEPKPGMVVDFGESKGRIQAVSGGRVRVDFNHPLAGKNLNYEIKIKEKIEGAENQVFAVLEFFGIEAAKEDAEISGNNAVIRLYIPKPLKDNVASLILRYVSGIERVDFLESYKKKPQGAENRESKET